MLKNVNQLSNISTDDVLQQTIYHDRVFLKNNYLLILKTNDHYTIRPKKHKYPSAIKPKQTKNNSSTVKYSFEYISIKFFPINSCVCGKALDTFDSNSNTIFNFFNIFYLTFTVF